MRRWTPIERLDTHCRRNTVICPTEEADPGAIVKWDHATMAWLNLGFKSPWLHCFPLEARCFMRLIQRHPTLLSPSLVA